MKLPRKSAQWLLLLTFGFAAPHLAKADATWIGGADEFWTTSANWLGTHIPLNGDLVIFNNLAVGHLSNVVSQTTIIKGLIISNLTANLTPAGGVVIASSFNSVAVGASGIDMSQAATNLTISAPVSLSPNQPWTVAANRRLTITGPISGPAGFYKDGLGTLYLTGTNSFTGSITNNGGAIWFNGNTNWGIGVKTIYIANNTLGAGIHLNGTNRNIIFPSTITWFASQDAGTVFNEAGDNVINGTINLMTGGGDAYMVVNAGTLTLNGNFQNNVSPLNMRIGGVGNGTINGSMISGGFQLLKQDSGTWTISSNSISSAYGSVVVAGTNNAGPVSGSTLIVNGQLRSTTAPVSVTTNATLSGYGMIRGPTTIQSGGTLALGNNIGTLSVSNNLKFRPSATNLMKISKAGTTLTNDLIQGVAITYDGTLTVTASGDALGGGDSFRLYKAFTYNGSFAALNLPALGPNLFWDTSLLSSNGTLSVGPPPPTISCPSNVTQLCVGPGGTPVSYTPTAADSYGNPLVVTCIPPSGTLFPAGSTPVFCTTTDSAGSPASCTFTVTVTDSVPVSISVNVETNLAVFRWPETCSSYLLQESAQVSGPWVYVDPAPLSAYAFSYTNGIYRASTPLGPGAKYVRLVRGPRLIFSQFNLNLDDGGYPNTDWGSLDLTYVGSDLDQYVNLSVNSSWQIQNVPLANLEGSHIPQLVSFDFRIAPFGVPVANVGYGISLTPFPIGAMPLSSYSAHVQPILVFLYDGMQGPSNVYVPATPMFGGGDVVTNKSGSRPGITNNMDVGKQECVPGAVINGLLNLGLSNDLINMTNMKVAVGWVTNQGAPYGWWTNKNDWMTNHDTHISTTTTTDINVAIAALKNTNCVVEMGAGGPTGGHYAVVRDIKAHGKEWTITVSQDTKQGVAGGAKNEEIIFTPSTGKFFGGFGFSGRKLVNFVIECRE